MKTNDLFAEMVSAVARAMTYIVTPGALLRSPVVAAVVSLIPLPLPVATGLPFSAFVVYVGRLALVL